MRSARYGKGESQLAIPKPGKKITRTKQRQHCNRLMALFVILRDRRCVICGKLAGLQAGHYFGRSIYALLYDPRNTYAQCEGCNILHESNAEPFRKFLIDKVGIEVFIELGRIAGSESRKLDYGKIEEDLRFHIRELSAFYTLPPQMQEAVLAGKCTNSRLISALNY